jgi:regulator of protease activity HflC (stomatin/prohibitin superfamily)
MNINYPWLIVEKGQVTESKPKGVLAELGGPGVIVIRPGNVVVLERHGAITQVAGPGLIRTKRFEQIREIVELKPKWTSATLENVLTADRIPLRVSLGVGFQLEPKSVVDSRAESHLPPDGLALSPLISDGVYEVYEASIRKAVFNLAAKWEITTFAVGENLLRDIMATYDFDQIFELRNEKLDGGGADPFHADKRTIKGIEVRLSEDHSRLAAGWGVHIRSVDIKTVEIPAEAQEQMIDWWRAKWRRLVAFQETEAVREHVERRGLGEAAAIETIEHARGMEQDRLITSLCDSLQAIQQTFSPADLKLAERLLRVMERLSKTLSGTDAYTTVRYVEALERMAGESGTKVLMVGDRRDWLPPLLREGDERNG